MGGDVWSLPNSGIGNLELCGLVAANLGMHGLSWNTSCNNCADQI